MNMQIIFTADTPDGCAALAPVILAATEAFKVLEASRATAALPAPAVEPAKVKKATPKAEAPPTPEAAPVAAEEVADAPPVLPETEEPAAEAQRITLEMVRLKMKELLDGGKRSAIEKALSDRGLKNASALEEAQFAGFYNDLLAA